MMRGARVSLRGEDEIAVKAEFVRQHLGTYIRDEMLDVVTAIEHNVAGFEVVEPEELDGLFGLTVPSDGKIKIILPIYESAVAGDPFARHVMAHELGHLVMHDSGMSYASAFAGEILRKEENSEWQADVFADYLLAPIKVIKATQTAAQLSSVCGIPLLRAITLKQKRKYR